MKTNINLDEYLNTMIIFSQLFSNNKWSYSMEGDSNYAKIYLHNLGHSDLIKGSDSLRGYCGEANAKLITTSPILFNIIKNIVTELQKERPKIENIYNYIQDLNQINFSMDQK